jgi:hypothetical protein
MTTEPRWPDFLIIGAMKCGTTPLFRWLGEQPEIRIPEIKEPHFFSRKERWFRALDWCGSLLANAGKLPKPIRGLGKRLLTRRDARYAGRVSESLAPILAGLLEPLWDDGARLAAWLGRTPPLSGHNGDGRGA